MTSVPRHRRQALGPSQILNQLPAAARAKHFSGTREEPTYPLEKASTDVHPAKTSTRRCHIRRAAMNWEALATAMAYTTPTSLFPTKTGERKPPPPAAPCFNRYTNQQLGIALEHHKRCESDDRPSNDQPSPDINALLAQLSCADNKPKFREELSSLDYSDSSDDDSDVPECVEKAIFASVAVALDFSSIEKATEDFQCAICLETGTLDSATVSGCHHTFCFSCINRWAAKKNKCPLCEKEFHLVASRRQVRWY